MSTLILKIIEKLYKLTDNNKIKSKWLTNIEANEMDGKKEESCVTL